MKSTPYEIDWTMCNVAKLHTEEVENKKVKTIESDTVIWQYVADRKGMHAGCVR